MLATISEAHIHISCLFTFFLETAEGWVYVEYWLPTTASPPHPRGE